MNEINIEHFELCGVQPMMIEKSDDTFIITYRDVDGDLLTPFTNALQERPYIMAKNKVPYVICRMEVIYDFALEENHFRVIYASPSKIAVIKKKAGKM